MQQPVMVPRKQNRNCLKPLFGCIMGPILLVVCVGACACACVAAVAVGSPDPLYDDFEAKQVLADSYEQSITTPISAAVDANGDFTLRIQQEEFTAWLQLEYDNLSEKYEHGDENSRNNLDPELQVKFEDGKIKLYAGQEWLMFMLGSRIDARVSIPQSEFSRYLLDVEITRIELGAFSLEDSDPWELGDRIAEVLTDQVETYSQSSGIQVEFTSVTAADGVLILQGRAS